MRESNDADPTNPRFKEVWDRVPKPAQTAYVMNRPDVEVLAKAEEPEPVEVKDPDVDPKVTSIVDKYLGREADFIRIADKVNQRFLKRVVEIKRLE